MNTVRYQVFLSSTFVDLEDERKEVMSALQKAGYFVAGMELFPSDTDESWAVIKRVIDQSDYYVLVIAGRYGSLAKDGKSFTEKEYDYAKDNGVPILSFIHANRDDLPSKHVEKENLEKLVKFIERIEDAHARRPWTTKEDLSTEVLASLSQAVHIRPRTGWVRGDAARKTDELQDRLNRLQQEYNRVREERDALAERLESAQEDARQDEFARDDDEAWVRIVTTIPSKTNDQGSQSRDPVEVTWGALFSWIAPKLIGWTSRREVEQTLLGELRKGPWAISTAEHMRVEIDDDSMTAIRDQFIALGLIEIGQDERERPLAGRRRGAYTYTVEVWKLTDKGLFEMSAKRAQRRRSD